MVTGWPGESIGKGKKDEFVWTDDSIGVSETAGVVVEIIFRCEVGGA
jgi:hypothetical protein